MANMRARTIYRGAAPPVHSFTAALPFRKGMGSMIHSVQFEQWVPVPLERVFLFFANPSNLPRIMPPQTGTELVRLKLVPPPGIAEESATITDRAPLAGAGSEIVTSFRVVPFLPFRAQWTALITEFEWNHHFADVQKRGPFKSFHHRHELRRRNAEAGEGNHRSRRDRIRCGIWLAGRSGPETFCQPPAAANIRLSTAGAGKTVGIGTEPCGDGSETRPTWPVVTAYRLGSTTTAVPYASTSVTPCITSVAS